MMSLNEWEKHTGSRKKNWKMSINKLKSTGEPLIDMLDESLLPQALKKQSCYKLQVNSYSPVCANGLLNDMLFVDGLRIRTTINYHLLQMPKCCPPRVLCNTSCTSSYNNTDEW